MCPLCSGSQKPLGGLGDGEEARTEAPAELLPAVGVEVGVALEVLVVEHGPGLPGEIDPELDDGARHLRMELRAPGRLAEAVALEARAAPGEWDGAGGKGELVVVPLKRRKPLGERAEDGVALGLGEPLELGILAGVTRAVLLEEAPALGYAIEEGAFPLADLAAAEEAFTSSSVREVMPVVRLDGAPVGSGEPGEAARSLEQALRNAALRP